MASETPNSLKFVFYVVGSLVFIALGLVSMPVFLIGAPLVGIYLFLNQLETRK